MQRELHRRLEDQRRRTGRVRALVLKARQPGGAFPAAAHEAALDRLTMIAQQHDEQLQRTIRLPVSEPAGGQLPAVADRAARYLAFDADGKPIATTVAVGAAVVSGFMQTLLDDADAATARGTLGISLTGVDIFAGDYGAVGDGATDDTAALAAAIAACSAGQRLRLVAGRTYIATGITLNRAGMVLDLNGATIRLAANAGAGAKLVTIGADDVAIAGPGTLDGNRANQSVTANQAVVYDRGFDRLAVAGIHITGGGVYGFYGEDTADCRVRGCRVTDCATVAIQWVTVAGNVASCVTADCFVDQTATAGAGIHYSQSVAQGIEDCRIDGCRVACSALAAVDVVHFWGAGTRNSVVDTHVSGGDIGISIANGQSHSRVVGCTAFDAGAIGIEVADSTYCAVVGCAVDGNGNTPTGISIDGSTTDAQSTAVTGNTVQGVTGQGILLFSGAPGSTVAGNAVNLSAAGAFGIRVLASPRVTLSGNNLEGNGTASLGIVIDKSSYVSCDGNAITNWAAQAIAAVQDMAGTLDYISITGGLIENTLFFQFLASGGGALGTHISHANVAGWATVSLTAALGDVWDRKNFIGRFHGAGASPEGLVAAGVGSLYVQTDGAAGNQLWVKESGTGSAGWRRQENRLTVEITVSQADLAAAGTKTLVAAVPGARFKVRNILLSGAGTSFAGGDRNIAIRDSSGTTVFTVMTAAGVQALAATRWGDAGVPFPATAVDLTGESVAGEALVASYSGGTTDYAAGSLTLIIEYERTT